MTQTTTAADIFQDAKQLHAEAVQRLEAGDIRDAAEKAWCATKRATDALILVRSDELPNNVTQTSSGIRALGQRSRELASLRTRFGEVARFLHGDCFYNGQCEPEDYVAALITGTIGYIDDAERLAAGHGEGAAPTSG